MYSKTTSSAVNRKQATHERIVDVASRAIRRSGYGGTGVADIMKEAGLTHGGFYAHFPSRDALMVAAGGRACDESFALASQLAAAVPPSEKLLALMNAYMSPEHIASIEKGCPISALGSEIPRQSPEVRHAATAHIRKMIDLFARHLTDKADVAAHEKAMSLMCALIGTTMVARVVDDPALSSELCAATLKQFSPAAG